MERLHVLALLLEDRNRDADRGGDEDDGEDVARQERIHKIVRNGVQDVSVDRVRRLRQRVHRVLCRGRNLRDRIRIDRARLNNEVKSESDQRGDERGEHRERERLHEDPAHRTPLSERRHRRQNRQRHRRHGDELEAARVGGRDKVHERIERRRTDHAERGTD